MITYDTTYVCTDPECLDYVPIVGYSMAPDSPPLVILGECPGCGKDYEFSIDEVGQLTITEL